MILFFFNKPAFEKSLRALSVREGEKFTMSSSENRGQAGGMPSNVATLTYP